MIGVHMGDVNFINLLGLITGCFQIGDQIPKGGAKQAGCAGINQYQLVAGIDEVAIDGCFQRVFQIRLGERFIGAAGAVWVNKSRTGRLTVPSDRAVTSKSPSIMR